MGRSTRKKILDRFDTIQNKFDQIAEVLVEISKLSQGRPPKMMKGMQAAIDVMGELKKMTEKMAALYRGEDVDPLEDYRGEDASADEEGGQ